MNIEFQSRSKLAAQSAELAWAFRDANEKYATDYPAQVGNHMTNTDSTPFQDLTPAISLRELERGSEMGAGWDPTWHQPTDVFTHFSDGDFRLGPERKADHAERRRTARRYPPSGAENRAEEEPMTRLTSYVALVLIAAARAAERDRWCSGGAAEETTKWVEGEPSFSIYAAEAGKRRGTH